MPFMVATRTQRAVNQVFGINKILLVWRLANCFSCLNVVDCSACPKTTDSGMSSPNSSTRPQAVATLTMRSPTRRLLTASRRSNFLMDSPAPFKVNCSMQVWDSYVNSSNGDQPYDSFLENEASIYAIIIANAVDAILPGLKLDDKRPCESEMVGRGCCPDNAFVLRFLRGNIVFDAETSGWPV